MDRRIVSWASATMLGFVLTGCATAPSYPLLTPIQVAKDFGYSENQLANNQWEVSYVTPTQNAYGFRLDHTPAENQGKTMAFDLAVWRASQLAIAKGFTGFAVHDRKSAVDAINADGVASGPCGYGWGGFHRWGGGPWGWGDDCFYQPPERTLQTEVKLTITFENTLKPGDFDAKDSIQQLTHTYPGADGSPVTPIPPKPAPVPAA